MFTRTFTYTNFDGKKVSETFHFHMSKADLIKLQMSGDKRGFQEYVRDIVRSKEGEKIIEAFEKVIMMTVGRKSDDGMRFDKSPEIQQDFRNSEAFSILLTELATDAKAGAEFLRSAVPTDIGSEMPDPATIDFDNLDFDAPDEDDTPAEEPEETRENWFEYEEQELLDMDQPQFKALFDKVGKNKPKPLLTIAAKRRSQ